MCPSTGNDMEKTSSMLIVCNDVRQHSRMGNETLVKKQRKAKKNKDRQHHMKERLIKRGRIY